MQTDAANKANPEQLTEDDRNLLTSVRNRFAAYVYVGPDGGNGITLFTTDTPDLWELFLNTIPIELRQVYTCNACRKFVERFGGLVSINEAGIQHSVMWGDGHGVFQRAVDALSNRVEKARITGVFVSSEPRWGTPFTGPWSHFAVTPPPKMVWKSRTKAANERAAELREEFGILRRSLAEYPVEVIRNAHNLLTTDQLYRSEKCIGVAEWALNLHNTIAARPDRLVREATTWLAAATAPPGFCHIKTTAISSLLDNIVAGKDFATIKREFDAMMAPTRYQRAQTPPAAAIVEKAEAIVARLGIERSLLRRYARIDEVVPLWTPIPSKSAAKPEAPETPGGVFAHLKTKEDAAPPATVVANATTMTWEKFQRMVLPGAVRVEALVPSSADRFAALVTAVDLEAPPILQWDRASTRNPVSWYYAAGIDAEVKRRVVGAGAQYENVDIRASLIWNNRNDLDLHVITPRGEHIFFADKHSTCGGWLDVDMNVRGETLTPVENIRWARGQARDGNYRVYVQNYAFHELRSGETPFCVELEVAGEVFQFDGVIPAHASGPSFDTHVASFVYAGRRLGTMAPGLPSARATGAPSWNLTPGAWAAVTAIAPSPNMWGDLPMTQHGEHLFFLLDGCRDTEQGIGRGFFVETLRSELREVRATLEAYTKSAPIAGVNEASACGLGMVKGRPWDLTLRVTGGSGVNTYKLDRWD